MSLANIRIDSTGVHYVPLHAYPHTAAPRSYIDSLHSEHDTSLNQIFTDIGKIDISLNILFNDISAGNAVSFWSGDPSDISFNGNVGIGRSRPRERLDVSGAIIVGMPKSMIDASDGTIIYSDASGFLGRKNNAWVPLDNSGSGDRGGGSGVGVPSFDASFNYYFMDPPLAPTDPSYALVTSSGTPYIKFSWRNPVQHRCAFNFVGSQPGPPDVSNNDSYNALPYFKGMRIQYRLFSPSGVPHVWADVSQNNVSGVWRNKDFLPRGIVKCYLNGSNGSYNHINSAHTDYSGSVITTGHSTQIRVAMVNGAQVNIYDPSYIQHGIAGPHDSSWNWLYIPDMSGVPLGNYGPAPRPRTLNVPPTAGTNLTYYSFAFSGACDNPSSANPVADVSLNTPFSIISSTSLRVQYRYDISGTRSLNSIQVGGNTGSVSQSAFNPDPSNNLTGLLNNWSAICSGASPLWDYHIPLYQMRNNEFAASWANADASAAHAITQIFQTPKPERYEATGTVLGGSSYQNFLQAGPINMSIHDLSASTPTVPSSAKPGQSTNVNPINNIYFLDRGDKTSLRMQPGLLFRCAANGNNNIGLDTSANEVMYFEADISHTIFDVSSEIFKGWTQDPSSVAQTINRNHIHFTTSDLSDARILAPPALTNGLRREEGFYLGIEISNVDVSNINLVDFPDISNNNPAYDPYTLHLYQMVRDASNSSTYHPHGPKHHEFRIGEKPNFDISYNHYKTSVNLGNLNSKFSPTPDFFGLYNIGSQDVNNITSTDISLNSIYTTWAAPDANNITNVEIVFNTAGAVPAVRWSQWADVWTYPLTSTRSLPARPLDLLRSKFTSYPYSRIHPRHPQFIVNGVYDNNIFGTQRITVTGGRPFPITDISFAGLPLWWDQTYHSFSLSSGWTGPNYPGNGEYPPFLLGDPRPYNTLYNNSNSILGNQLMWCNGGFTSGQYTTHASSNPYIDYREASGNFYRQIRDYSVFDNSGDVKRLSYTATNDDYWTGGNVDISGTYKWLMIEGQSSTAGNFAQVDIAGTVVGSASTLTLGTHYLLYVQEIDSYFDPANNTLPAGYTAGRSGWKAVHGTWDQGATVQLNNANEAGCYRRRTNTGQIAIHHIKLYSPNNNVPIFFRIGLQNTSNIKITTVTISYGTN